ncbi:MAG: 3-oxoadipyl-CoA thiolase [Actinomycetota bacterium]
MNAAYVCGYVRTPIGRYGGALSSVRPDDLAATVLVELLSQYPDLDTRSIDEVVLGCANQAGEDNRNVARMAALLAGFGTSVPAFTVNRLCASGMDAVIAGARSIACGHVDLVVAGGVESMSRAPLVMPKATTAFSRNAEVFDTTIGWRFVNPELDARYGTDSMPETAENVAADFAVSRADQDAFALRSQERAAAAIAGGRLGREIVPVAVPQRRGDDLIVDVDEHPRSTSLDRLAALPTPFRDGGTVTAGNASGVNDGAAVLLLASEAAVERHGLTPLARITGAASAGVEPRVMGVGPIPAAEKVSAQVGVPVDDFDVIELNEAFASQSLAVLRHFGLPDDAAHVNRNGGAIALGHPLGMSGARLVGTAALELASTEAETALAMLCVGVGQGVATTLAAV